MLDAETCARIRAVLLRVEYKCPNAMACSYAREGRRLLATGKRDVPRAMLDQLLYVKSNLGHWRGVMAVATKRKLLELISELTTIEESRTEL